jgi:glyoxylase-like metal-dependent hydrolase (beta-lactamase superfamily II)
VHARYTIDCDQRPRTIAAYLRVANGECAFVETGTAHAVPRFLDALSSRGLRVEDVRYIVPTHAHLDHAGGAGALLARCPNATLLAHPRAARNLIDPEKLIRSATIVYGEAMFRKLYGAIEPIPSHRVRVLEDGDAFELGGATLRVHHTLGHAKHHFVVDDPAIETVFTGDTFGLVYPQLQRGVRFALATTSPIDFDPAEARKSLDRVLALGERAACLTHFDEVRDLDEVARQVRAWVDRSEAWLDREAATDDPVDVMTKRIAASLREAIAADANARGLALTRDDWELLDIDVDLNAQGIAFVANARRKAD